jgi:hypothetical protein
MGCRLVAVRRCGVLPLLVQDVAGVAVVERAARIPNPILGRGPLLAFMDGWRPVRSVDRCLLVSSPPPPPALVGRGRLMAYAGCGAFSLLHCCLLDEGLRPGFKKPLPERFSKPPKPVR